MKESRLGMRISLQSLNPTLLPAGLPPFFTPELFAEDDEEEEDVIGE